MANKINKNEACKPMNVGHIPELTITHLSLNKKIWSQLPMYRIVKQALKNRNIKSMAVGHLFKVSNLVLLISNLNLWISLSPTTIASYQQNIVILLYGISGSTIMSKYGYTTYYYYLRYPCKRFSLQSCLNTYIDLPPLSVFEKQVS